MAVCVGPPDTIAMGSPTVLIGNQMAARQGDPTMHGGVIVMGFPTVIIGDSGSGLAGVLGLSTLCPAISMLDNLALGDRLESEKHIAEQILNLAPEQGAGLGQLRHDRDMAVLSAASYATKDGSSPILAAGYSAASPEDYDRLGITPAPDVKVFKTEAEAGTPHYVVSFRGTELGAGLRTAIADICIDLLQGMGLYTGAYDRTAETAKNAGASGESVEFTGHSKGGGQAALASAITGEPATTFNSAGVHSGTLKRAHVSNSQQEAMGQNIRAYSNERDPLNNAQDNRGKILSGAFAGSILAGAPGVGGVIAGVATTGGLPQASGQRNIVPAAQNQGYGVLEGHSINTLVQAMNEQVDKQLKAICGC